MATQSNRPQPMRLPARFPQGTRFIIEGRAGRINLRCLEFPDGRHIVLPADPAIIPSLSPVRRRRVAGRKSEAKKISILSGTVARV
jgi:hypothetical protein